jgi:hypothetical protein
MAASAEDKPRDIVDLRAPVTQADLVVFFKNAESDIWDLTIWGNKRPEGRPSAMEPEADDFQLLTKPQRALILVGMLDGEIGNGGVGQLFFNRANLVPAMQDALVEMNCQFAAGLLDRELERLAQSDFISQWLAARRGFTDHMKAQDKEIAWNQFMDFVDGYFPIPAGEDNDQATEAYYNGREETLACVKAYIKQNAAEYFDVIDSR